MTQRPLKVLGTAEVADRLGLTKVSVSRLIRQGRLVPDATLACGPVFRTSTIERVREERKR